MREPTTEERGIAPHQTEAEIKTARSERYRFLRIGEDDDKDIKKLRGTGIDLLALLGLTRPQGPFVLVQAVLPDDVRGNVTGLNGKRIITDAEATITDEHGRTRTRERKLKALTYEVLAYNAEAKEMRPELEVGMCCDHLASAADMVNPTGARTTSWVHAKYIAYLMNVDDANAAYDEYCAMKKQRADEAEEAEQEAKEAIAAERKKIRQAS